MDFEAIYLVTKTCLIQLERFHLENEGNRVGASFSWRFYCNRYGNVAVNNSSFPAEEGEVGERNEGEEDQASESYSNILQIQLQNCPTVPVCWFFCSEFSRHLNNSCSLGFWSTGRSAMLHWRTRSIYENSCLSI